MGIRFTAFLTLLLMISLSSLSFTSASVHELLKSRGLPAGLIPKDVKSYTLDENDILEVFLNGPCLTKYDTLVKFDSVVRANLSYGGLIGVVGLSQEELFLWLPVIDIIVDDPKSGVILFDIGLAHKQLSLSLFEEPPECNPPPGGLTKNVRIDKGYEGQSDIPSRLFAVQKQVKLVDNNNTANEHVFLI